MAEELTARTGRHQQRYDNEYRLVAGCIPYRYKESGEACNGTVNRELEVLMVLSRGGTALIFPKGGWENDESVQEAACRETFEEAGVRGIIKGVTREDHVSWSTMETMILTMTMISMSTDGSLAAPLICHYNYKSTKVITSKQSSVWEMVSQRHHEKDLGCWDFRSKRYQDDSNLEGFHRAHMFALLVTEQLDSWPEQNERQRKWVTITEADGRCKDDWMRQALRSCVTYLSSRQPSDLLTFD